MLVNCFFYSSQPLEVIFHAPTARPPGPGVRKHVDGTWWMVPGHGDSRGAEHGNHTRLSVTDLATPPPTPTPPPLLESGRQQ